MSNIADIYRGTLISPLIRGGVGAPRFCPSSEGSTHISPNTNYQNKTKQINWIEYGQYRSQEEVNRFHL